MPELEKQPGEEYANWKVGDPTPETGGKPTEVEDGLKAIKEQVETTNQKYQEYIKKSSEIKFDDESFSGRTLSKIRHAAENVEDGGDKSKDMANAYSGIIDTLTKMTPEQQISVDIDRRSNPATADYREKEFAQFRKIDTDKLLATYLINRAQENGATTDEISYAESILNRPGVSANRADTILDELTKYRTLDKNFMTPKNNSV